MIVKIVRPNTTRFVDADSFRIRSFEDNNEEVIVEFSKSMNFQLTKETSQMYVLNEEGQTVEAYIW